MLFRKGVLLIHGFAGGQYDYGELSNELEYISNFDVFTFTLPGHDKLKMRKINYNDWINSAEDQINKLIKHGYNNIYIVGHSMGGVIASHLAVKYNQYVKKLVLATPAFKYMYFKDNKIDLIKTIKETPKIFEGLSTEKVLSRVFKTSLESAIEFIKLVNNYNNTPTKITCPTLIIHGNNDKIVPKDSCLEVYHNIKSNYKLLYNINDVNHDCFTGERQEEVNNIVISFLKARILIPTNNIYDI